MKSIEFFPRFNSLNNDLISVDFHIHSKWTDGADSISDITCFAEKNGIKKIAITDHIRETSDYFDHSFNEICDLNKNVDIHIYSGFEAKISDFQGSVDVADSVVERADVAIASVHRFPLGSKLYNASEFSKKISQEMELELSLSAIKMGGFNVLGHPGGMSIAAYDEFPVDFFETIIVECKKNNIAFDFNGRYHCNYKDVLCKLLSKHNPHVSIGTDSHNINEMLGWNEQLKEVLKCQ